MHRTKQQTTWRTHMHNSLTAANSKCVIIDVFRFKSYEGQRLCFTKRRLRNVARLSTAGTSTLPRAPLAIWLAFRTSTVIYGGRRTGTQTRSQSWFSFLTVCSMKLRRRWRSQDQHTAVQWTMINYQTLFRF